MMGRAVAPILVLLGLVSAFEASATTDTAPFAPGIVERGRYLAIAADCAACHTATAGSPFAGGYALKSPLGTIYSSNITPSRHYGIGAYSEPQFASALRQGLRRDGAHLYPAMPYPSYTALSDADVQALYAYFMQAVAPVERAAPVTALPFPFNARISMAVWNALFLEDRRATEEPARSAEWNRGAYLAQALAHCGECHTPRGLLMQSQPAQALGGGALGGWFAPNITSDPIQGIGRWSRQEIVTYLKTGRLDGKARAAGSMAEAVTHSLSRLADIDLQAIATYLSTVPPVASSTAADRRSDWGRPVSSEATLRGTSTRPEGASLYSGLCASCHQVNGEGTPDQTIPSLFHNSTVGAQRADNLVAVILQGVDRETSGHRVFMPGFGEASYVQPLTNAQISAVANHVRSTYGRGAADVTEAEVSAWRQGAPRTTLTLLAGLGMGIGVLTVTGTFAAWHWSRGRTRNANEPRHM